jgi:hypothetical protein
MGTRVMGAGWGSWVWVRFAVSHPFAKEKANGWGTEL